MKKYIKPEIESCDIEPLKIFACSDECPEEDRLNIGYEESNKFWDSIKAD